jgi:hypothetical protein
MPANYSFGLPQALREGQSGAGKVFQCLRRPRNDTFTHTFVGQLKSGQLDFDYHWWDTKEFIIWVPLDNFNQLESFNRTDRAPYLPDLPMPDNIKSAIFADDPSALLWAKNYHDKCRKGTSVIELDADISLMAETYHKLPYRNMSELYALLHAHLEIPGFVKVVAPFSDNEGNAIVGYIHSDPVELAARLAVMTERVCESAAERDRLCFPHYSVDGLTGKRCQSEAGGSNTGLAMWCNIGQLEKSRGYRHRGAFFGISTDKVQCTKKDSASITQIACLSTCRSSPLMALLSVPPPMKNADAATRKLVNQWFDEQVLRPFRTAELEGVQTQFAGGCELLVPFVTLHLGDHQDLASHQPLLKQNVDCTFCEGSMHRTEVRYPVGKGPLDRRSFPEANSQYRGLSRFLGYGFDAMHCVNGVLSDHLSLMMSTVDAGAVDEVNVRMRENCRDVGLKRFSNFLKADGSVVSVVAGLTMGELLIGSRHLLFTLDGLAPEQNVFGLALFLKWHLFAMLDGLTSSRLAIMHNLYLCDCESRRRLYGAGHFDGMAPGTQVWIVKEGHQGGIRLSGHATQIAVHWLPAGYPKPRRVNEGVEWQHLTVQVRAVQQGVGNLVEMDVTGPTEDDTDVVCLENPGILKRSFNTMKDHMLRHATSTFAHNGLTSTEHNERSYIEVVKQAMRHKDGVNYDHTICKMAQQKALFDVAEVLDVVLQDDGAPEAEKRQVGGMPLEEAAGDSDGDDGAFDSPAIAPATALGAAVYTTHPYTVGGCAGFVILGATDRTLSALCCMQPKAAVLAFNLGLPDSVWAHYCRRRWPGECAKLVLDFCLC